MEGQGDMPLPEDKGSAKGGMNKMLAIAVVAIVVIAAVAGALLLMGGPENKSPTASVTASATVITAGQSVTYNGSASSDPEGGILKFTWQFGDGGTDNTTGELVSHQYVYPGRYMVLLTVEDEKGLTGNNLANILRIEVLNPEVTEPTNDTAPFAFVAVDGDQVANNTEVTFDGNSSFGYDWETPYPEAGQFVKTMAWNFADGSAIVSGNYSADGVVSHIFTGAGVIYNTYLTVTSDYDATQRYYYSILVGSTGGGAKNPDRFIMATIGEPDKLDPATDYETAGGEIIQNVYETLIFYDGSSASELIPMLATTVPTVANGGISVDGLHYTFHLRENVIFHDGTDMTAEDVYYSLGRGLVMNNADGPFWMFGQVMVDDYWTKSAEGNVTWDDVAAAIHVVDDYTVTINLTFAYPAFIYVMAYNAASVVSKDYVEANGGVVPNEESEFMDRHTCGTGPYQLVEWVPNSHILMVKNDNYWKTQKANLKYVIIKKVQDVGTRILMLKSGDADSIYLPRDHESDVIGETETIRIVKDLPTFNMDFLGLNQNISNVEEVGDIPATFFADKNVRLAFCHAFEYDLYIQSVFLGGAEQPNGIIPAGMFGYDASIPIYDYNLTKAAEYLALAENPDAPGQSFAETGFTMTVYHNAGNLPRETACQLLKQGMESLSSEGLIDGTISITVLALDWPVYLTTLQNKQLPAFFLGWAPDYADPDNYVNPFIHSSGTYAKRCAINNATLTAWAEEAAMELDDTARTNLYHNISVGVYDNAFYVWTAQATNFHVERTWVVGYYYNPMYAGYYYYVFSKTA